MTHASEKSASHLLAATAASMNLGIVANLAGFENLVFTFFISKLTLTSDIHDFLGGVFEVKIVASQPFFFSWNKGPMG